jgi:hypothetical protein
LDEKAKKIRKNKVWINKKNSYIHKMAIDEQYTSRQTPATIVQRYKRFKN